MDFTIYPDRRTSGRYSPAPARGDTLPPYIPLVFRHDEGGGHLEPHLLIVLDAGPIWRADASHEVICIPNAGSPWISEWRPVAQGGGAIGR